MARTRPPKDTPLEHHWVCEGCANVFVGVSPPDKCDFCEHVYFGNLADEMKERDATGGRLH